MPASDSSIGKTSISATRDIFAQATAGSLSLTTAARDQQTIRNRDSRSRIRN